MNRTSQLEYAKTILTKVAFDRALFIKEYQKAMKSLNPREKDHLRHWLRLYAPTDDAVSNSGGYGRQGPGLWLVKKPSTGSSHGISIVVLYGEMDIRHQKPGDYQIYTSREEALSGARVLKRKHQLSAIRIVYPNGTFELVN